MPDPVMPRAMAISSTVPAPMKLPTEKNAWKRLMIGLRRAASTWTPSAFIATSMAPLPRPNNAAARIATG